MFIAPFLFPMINDGKRIKKVCSISLIVYFVYLLLGVIALLFLIPSITEINNTLSIYILSRRVNLGTFIQRIDAVFILIWIMSIFNYLAITMHYTLSTFKKITNIKHEGGMIFCFSALLYTISMLPKNISDISIFEGTIYKYVSIIFVFFITMAILIWAYFKKKKSMQKGAR